MSKTVKFGRIILVMTLAVFFVVCYYFQPKTNDPLAHYAYADNHNRKAIIDNLSSEEIDYIVDNDIKPEEFMSFMVYDNFVMQNTKEYYKLSQSISQPANLIVDYVNLAKEKDPYDTYAAYATKYTLTDLIQWYQEGDKYAEGSTLVTNPDSLDLTLDNTHTLYRYEPSDLEEVTALTTTISTTITLRKEANEALGQMCALAKEELGGDCGGLIGVSGYKSYDTQVTQYDQKLLIYGPTKVYRYILFPGHNEEQTGLTIELSSSSLVNEVFSKSTQYQWLKDNAYKFGFILRYPADAKYPTRMDNYNQLRYVGTELAKTIQQSSAPLEEAGKGL